jgi:hypothetical protein
MSQYEKILLAFLTITTQIKLYHWQTLSHPRHVAAGNLYSELDELVDMNILNYTKKIHNNLSSLGYLKSPNLAKCFSISANLVVLGYDSKFSL